MKRTFALSCTLPILLLGGCLTLAPDYSSPEAPVPDEWPDAGGKPPEDMAGGNAPRAAELQWQEFFVDPDLRQVIDIALANNRDLRLAALNVEKARALYGVQRAELFPSLSAIGSGSKQRASADLIDSSQPRTSERYEVNLGIASWEIDLFGRIRSLKDQALEEYLATEQAQRGARLSLISEIAAAYLTLAADHDNLKLAQSTLETQQAVHDLILRQYEAAVANEIDVHRAKTQIDAARVDLARYTLLAAQTRNALNLLAGAAVPKELLPSSLADVEPPTAIRAGLPSEPLLSRPDIMAAEHQLKGAYAVVGAARAAFFPRIALTTAMGTASDELSRLLGTGADTWNFSPRISMPIFDPRVWTAHRVSKTVRKIALARYEKTIQTAFKEVADALAVSQTVEGQIEAQQSLADSAARIHELAGKRYANGIDSYLGVLDAQRSLYGAQQGLISLKLARLANLVRMYAVLGGGAGPAPGL